MPSIVRLNQVSYRYSDKHMALNAVDLDIPEGEKTAILGRNGAGKSTLLFLLNGLLKPSAGKLSLKGESYSYTKKGLRNIRKIIGLLFPNPDAQLIAPTVYEELSFGLMNLSDDLEWVRQRIEAVSQAFELEELWQQNPHRMSTGQKKRICLAAILAMEPEVLLCDEPAANLDNYHAEQLFAEMQRLNDKGNTIIYTTHDVDQAYNWADHFILMHQGQILATGTADNVFNQTDLWQECGLKQPILVQLAQQKKVE